MITNLFSIYDPSMSVINLYWTCLISPIIIIPAILWTNNSLLLNININTINFIINEISYLNSTSNAIPNLIITLLTTLIFYNTLALFPHIFSSTSHLCITLPLSFSIWLSIIIFSLWNYLPTTLSHLVPSGTPIFLISFIVIVETISILIRPLSLIFRLTANIIAGHLLLSLISITIFNTSPINSWILIIVQTLLVFIEIAVALIQSYVFCTLLLLYLSETNN